MRIRYSGTLGTKLLIEVINIPVRVIPACSIMWGEVPVSLAKPDPLLGPQGEACETKWLEPLGTCSVSMISIIKEL